MHITTHTTPSVLQHLHKVSFTDFRKMKEKELQVPRMLSRCLSHLFLLVAELIESNAQARGNKKERMQ